MYSANEHDIDPIPNSLIARGSFGEISLAINRANREILVVKTILNSLSSNRSFVSHRSNANSCNSKNLLKQEVRNEIKALKELNANGGHENIVPLISVRSSELDDMSSKGENGGDALTSFFASSFDNPSVTMIFPYCPCDLADAMYCFKRKEDFDVISLPVVKAIARDVLSGLAFCHDQGFVHGDIKPGNVLLNDCDGACRAQLCDFGLSMPINSHDMVANGSTGSNRAEPKGLCTLNYRSPEALYGSNHASPKIDIWGASLVIVEMLYHKFDPFFDGRNVLDQLGKIFEVLGTPSKDTWPSISQLPDYHKVSFENHVATPISDRIPILLEDSDLDAILLSMLCLDPSQRPTASECLLHPCFTNKASIADSNKVLQTLQLSHLRQPLLFFSDGKALEWAKKISSCRRTLTNRFCPKYDETKKNLDFGIFSTLSV